MNRRLENRLQYLRRKRGERFAAYVSQLGKEDPESIAAAKRERASIDEIDAEIEAATRVPYELRNRQQ